MILTLLLIAALAINAAVEILHHSKIARPIRARLEARDDALTDIIECPYCLSYHVGYVITTLLVLTSWSLGILGFFGGLFLAVPFWLASTRLANLINDVFKSKLLTPKLNRFDDEVKPFNAGTTDRYGEPDRRDGEVLK